MATHAGRNGKIKRPRLLRFATAFYFACSMAMGFMFFKTFMATVMLPWTHTFAALTGLYLYGLVPGAMLILSFLRPAAGTLNYPPNDMFLSRWAYSDVDTGKSISKKDLLARAPANVVCWRDARPLFMLAAGAVAVTAYVLTFYGVTGSIIDIF